MSKRQWGIMLIFAAVLVTVMLLQSGGQDNPGTNITGIRIMILPVLFVAYGIALLFSGYVCIMMIRGIRHAGRLRARIVADPESIRLADVTETAGPITDPGALRLKTRLFDSGFKPFGVAQNKLSLRPLYVNVPRTIYAYIEFGPRFPMLFFISVYEDGFLLLTSFRGGIRHEESYTSWAHANYSQEAALSHHQKRLEALRPLRGETRSFETVQDYCDWSWEYDQQHIFADLDAPVRVLRLRLLRNGLWCVAAGVGLVLMLLGRSLPVTPLAAILFLLMIGMAAVPFALPLHELEPVDRPPARKLR